MYSSIVMMPVCSRKSDLDFCHIWKCFYFFLICKIEKGFLSFFVRNICGLFYTSVVQLCRNSSHVWNGNVSKSSKLSCSILHLIPLQYDWPSFRTLLTNTIYWMICQCRSEAGAEGSVAPYIKIWTSILMHFFEDLRQYIF